MSKYIVHDEPDDNLDSINVPDVSYQDILKQKRVLEKLVANQPITPEETKELEGTLHLLDYLQDHHRADTEEIKNNG